MKINICRSLLVVGVLALSMQQAVADGSGFIEDMPQLTQDPDRAGAMIWQKPGVNRASYTRVVFEPLTIFISADSPYKGLNPTNLKGLTDRFRDAVINTLEPEVAVVNKAGPGVLYVRVAINDVKVEKKKRGLLGYTPIGFVAGAATEAASGPSVSLKDATLEIEMLDSVSGERLGVLVEKAPKLAADEELSWDSISKTLVFYAERFKARMQAAQ